MKLWLENKKLVGGIYLSRLPGGRDEKVLVSETPTHSPTHPHPPTPHPPIPTKFYSPTIWLRPDINGYL